MTEGQILLASQGKSATKRKRETADRLKKRRKKMTTTEQARDGSEKDEEEIEPHPLESCFFCSEHTTHESAWEGIVLCDLCLGEYHCYCVGLDDCPLKKWTCATCRAHASLEGLRYSVDLSLYVSSDWRFERTVCLLSAPGRTRAY
jgi:hypothetical protein